MIPDHTSPEDTKKILASLRNSLAEKTNAYARLSGLPTGEVIALMGGLGPVQCGDQVSQIRALQDILTSLEEALKTMDPSSQQHDGRDSQQQPAISGSSRGFGPANSGKTATKTTTKNPRFATRAYEAMEGLPDNQMLP